MLAKEEVGLPIAMEPFGSVRALERVFRQNQEPPEDAGEEIVAAGVALCPRRVCAHDGQRGTQELDEDGSPV